MEGKSSLLRFILIRKGGAFHSTLSIVGTAGGEGGAFQSTLSIVGTAGGGGGVMYNRNKLMIIKLSLENNKINTKINIFPVHILNCCLIMFIICFVYNAFIGMYCVVRARV